MGEILIMRHKKIKETALNKVIFKFQEQELLSTKAYRALKEAIVRGDIKSHTKLTLNEIAQQMDISTTPVREAVNHLASEGLLKLIPNKGIMVNKISIDDYQEILLVRSALEGLIAELASAKINEEEMDAIMGIIYRMEESVKKDERLVFNDLDIKFHDFLLQIAGNRELTDLYNRLMSKVYRFRLRTLQFAHRMAESFAEHKAIALSVKSGDAFGANEASRKHIMNILKTLEEDVGRDKR